jgi:hypothetical protein
MHIKISTAKIATAIAPFALTAAIMAPTAAAADGSPSGHSSNSPGVLSGNVVVNVPKSGIDEECNVIGLLNPACAPRSHAEPY